MTAQDLLTVGTMQEMLKPFFAEFNNLKAIAAKASDCYLTVDEAAEYVKHSRITIMKWIKEGKTSRGGKTIYLKASEFAPQKYRISKQDLDAFGRAGLD